MKPVRTILFWMHLACGVVAGTVVLIMCVTGVALTYEKQMLEWADRRAWTAPPPSEARPLSPETLLAQVQAARPGTAPTGVTLRADRRAPATVLLEGPPSRAGASARQAVSLLVDPYTGAIIGEPPAALRTFFRTMTVWHRYIAMDGGNRVFGKSITGASNLAFLFIVISGTYLWLPRVWSWKQFKNVLWFRGGLAPKARDFNWHNVIGIWSAVPLAVVIAGAVPISYPWASTLVYRLAGDTPPPPAAAPRVVEQAPTTYVAAGIDRAWAGAQSQIPSWRTMTTRLATSNGAPVVITVDAGYGGQPQKRTTMAFNRSTGVATKTESFGDLGAGRRARTWLRFAHTGEIYGLIGQTVAGLVTAGGAVLVYTGLALALRRFAAWLRRRATPEGIERRRAA